MSISGKPKDLFFKALGAAYNIKDLLFDFLISVIICYTAGDGYGDDGR